MTAFLSCVFIFLFSGCYYGPGVSRVETNAVRRSARDLSPAPIISQQSNALGQNLIAPILDSTLTPLILGDESFEDPDQVKRRDYEANMRRQQKAMDELDRQLDQINNN